MLKKEHREGALQRVAYAIPKIVPGIPIVGERVPFLSQTVYQFLKYSPAHLIILSSFLKL